MLAWLIALAAGAAFATLGYAGRGRPTGPAAIAFVLAALARFVAVTLAVALLLDAPRGAARPQTPLVALDVSASWRRGGRWPLPTPPAALRCAWGASSRMGRRRPSRRLWPRASTPWLTGPRPTDGRWCW
jgi:hypothetical protein